jgi:hypothetical protein
MAVYEYIETHPNTFVKQTFMSIDILRPMYACLVTSKHGRGRTERHPGRRPESIQWRSDVDLNKVYIGSGQDRALHGRGCLMPPRKAGFLSR